MRRRVAPALVGLLLVQCFAVPERGCEDTNGLFVEYHLCMPPAGFSISVAKLVLDLKRADFDGEGIANDLAGLAYFGEADAPETWDASVLVVQMRKELGTPQQDELSVPVGTVDVTPVYVGSNRQSLAYALDDSDGAAAGKIGLILNSDGIFAAEPVTGPLTNFLAQGCRAPADITTLEAEPVVLVTCEREGAPEATVLFSRADIGVVDLEQFAATDGTGFYFFGIEQAEIAGVHGTVLFDGDGEAEGMLFGAAISKPTAGDSNEAQNLEHDKVVVVRVAELDAGMMPQMPEMAAMATVRLEDGPIEDLYAGELDGAGTVELITRHQDRGRLTVLRQEEPGTLAFVIAGEPLEVPEPYDVAIGDFTGDGAADIAVAYIDAGVGKLGVFIRAPDDEELVYALAEMGGVGSGELVTAIEALDVDRDDALDLATAVLVPEVGTEVRVYLNRAAGPR